MAVRAGLKNWKDSAGVILISGAFKYARPPTPISKLANLGESPLIVPLDELNSDDKEWALTMVQRGSKTGFYGESSFGFSTRLSTNFQLQMNFHLVMLLATSQQICLPWWQN